MSDLHALRVALNLTADELARLIGAHRLHVVAWEAGHGAPDQFQADLLATFKKAVERSPVACRELTGGLLAAQGPVAALGFLLNRSEDDLNRTWPG